MIPRAVAFSFLCLLFLLAAACERAPSAQEAAAPSPLQRLARGAYLVKVAGCDDCHTPGGLYGAPDHQRRLAGSELGWQGPWGVSYPPNLTPHVQTGLGRWSEQDIVHALRTGRRPDGTALRPPMPWPNFSTMTDEDLDAIAFFLKSLPPVEHVTPALVQTGGTPTGPAMVFPPPPAWDAPRQPAGPAQPPLPALP